MTLRLPLRFVIHYAPTNALCLSSVALRFHLLLASLVLSRFELVPIFTGFNYFQ